MKTLVKAIVLSISTALVAIPAMAAPQDHHQPHKSHAQHHHAPQHHQLNKHPAQQHKQGYKKVDPSRDWRVGQKVPNQYQSKIYKVDHSKYKRLSKPGRNQQWIKVNGDYILMNMINDKIIKIITA